MENTFLLSYNLGAHTNSILHYSHCFTGTVIYKKKPWIYEKVFYFCDFMEFAWKDY